MYRLCKPLKGKSVKLSFDAKRSECYVPSPVTPVRIVKLPDGVVKFCNDVHLLFNQERLNKLLGADTLQSWLGSLDSNYRKAVDTSKLPDDVVLKFCKSRYIQSPSELLAWSQYLNAEAYNLVKEYNEEVANSVKEQAAQSSESAQSVEPKE